MPRLTNDNVPNPIILVNEWRDTLFLTALAVAWGCGVASIPKIADCIFWRETLRFWAWRAYTPMQKVGGPQPPDYRSVGEAALFLSNAAALMSAIIEVRWFAICFFSSALMVQVALTMAFFGYRASAEEFLRAWDWPRKSHGGPGEAAKFKSWSFGTLTPAASKA